jgi:hypothetical protein
MSGYYAQSHAENAFARFKQTFGVVYVRSGTRSKHERRRSRASCSTGCGSWVTRNPTPSAKRGVHRDSARSTRFMQQTLIDPEMVSDN